VKIKLELDKAAQDFIASLSGFDPRFRTEMLQATDNVGMTLVAGTRKVIMTQNFPPISLSWRRWKLSKGYDGRILLMSFQMFNQIDYKRIHSNMTIMSGQVGFRKSAMHHHWTSNTKHRNGEIIPKSIRTRKGSARAKHSHSSVPTADLAKWLEGYVGDGSQGRSQIPRPFFKPTLDQYKKILPRFYFTAFMNAFLNK
jgi:hypothetical protein